MGNQRGFFNLAAFAKVFYKYIGEIWGVPQLGADIDGDGVPEIVTNTLSPVFVNSTGYYKIHPQVKLLISYDAR